MVLPAAPVAAAEAEEEAEAEGRTGTQVHHDRLHMVLCRADDTKVQEVPVEGTVEGTARPHPTRRAIAPVILVTAEAPEQAMEATVVGVPVVLEVMAVMEATEAERLTATLGTDAGKVADHLLRMVGTRAAMLVMDEVVVLRLVLLTVGNTVDEDVDTVGTKTAHTSHLLIPPKESFFFLCVHLI